MPEVGPKPLTVFMLGNVDFMLMTSDFIDLAAFRVIFISAKYSPDGVLVGKGV